MGSRSLRQCAILSTVCGVGSFSLLCGGCLRNNPDFDAADVGAMSSEGDRGQASSGESTDGGRDTAADETGGSDGASAGDASSDDGGAIDCTGEETQIVRVETARVVPPMERAQSDMGEGEYARSFVPDDGSVTFEIELPCSDEWRLWGRILDHRAGTRLSDDPDSYYVELDGVDMGTWFYGCQTMGNDRAWDWAQIDDNEFQADCDLAVPLVAPLDAGAHELTLRNREPGDGQGAFAGVARILVTNESGYVPDDSD